MDTGVHGGASCGVDGEFGWLEEATLPSARTTEGDKGGGRGVDASLVRSLNTNDRFERLERHMAGLGSQVGRIELLLQRMTATPPHLKPASRFTAASPLPGPALFDFSHTPSAERSPGAWHKCGQQRLQRPLSAARVAMRMHAVNSGTTPRDESGGGGPPAPLATKSFHL